MKFKKHKKLISKLVPMIILVFFAFSYAAFASEINKDAVIQLVNKSRTENNVAILNENQILDKVAQDKLDDMIKNNYFAHTSPSGITPWHWFDENKYDYKYAGENLALGFSSVENEHQAWMDSPTHKKNILNSNYLEIGVAVGKGTIDGNLVTIAVQEFGTKAGIISGGKEENNLSDEKSEELLEKNKEEKKGIVLNTDTPNSNDGGFNDLLNDRKAEPKFSFAKFKDAILSDKDFIKNSIWITSISIMSICILVNILAILFLVFHYLVGYLRKNPDIFKVVHGLLILMLIGSIIM